MVAAELESLAVAVTVAAAVELLQVEHFKLVVLEIPAKETMAVPQRKILSVAVSWLALAVVEQANLAQPRSLLSLTSPRQVALVLKAQFPEAASFTRLAAMGRSLVKEVELAVVRTLAMAVMRTQAL